MADVIRNMTFNPELLKLLFVDHEAPTHQVLLILADVKERLEERMRI
jgi:hypothetical protein